MLRSRSGKAVSMLLTRRMGFASLIVLTVLVAQPSEAAVAKITSFIVQPGLTTPYGRLDDISIMYTLTWSTSGLGGEFNVHRKPSYPSGQNWYWLSGSSFTSPPGNVVFVQNNVYPVPAQTWAHVHAGSAANPVAIDNQYK